MAQLRALTRDEAVRWLDDHLGRFVAADVYVELPDDHSTRILHVYEELGRERLNYRGRYEGGEPPAEMEEMVRQLEERQAVYSLGHQLLDFTEIEHLEVWVEEGWLDASTHKPLDNLVVRLAPGAKLELKYVVGDA